MQLMWLACTGASTATPMASSFGAMGELAAVGCAGATPLTLSMQHLGGVSGLYCVQNPFHLEANVPSHHTCFWQWAKSFVCSLDMSCLAKPGL